jgi:hypothetical protein
MHPFDEMYTMTPFDGSDVRLHYKDYAPTTSVSL